MYFTATPCRRAGCQEVEAGALPTLASSKPGMPGGRKCVAMADELAAARLEAASRSNAARIALRTLMSSSGCRRGQREVAVAAARGVTGWSFWRCTTRLRTCAGGFARTRCWPSSTGGRRRSSRSRSWYLDLVQVRGAVVHVLVPVRVTDRWIDLPGLVADEPCPARRWRPCTGPRRRRSRCTSTGSPCRTSRRSPSGSAW